MISGTCPDCGAVRPLGDYLRDADVRAALIAALDCPPPLARAIVAYLPLHSPGARTIQAPRLARLLRDLAALLAAGEVEWKGQTRAAPLSVWEGAFAVVAREAAAGRVAQPLDGHGYLTAIAYRIAAEAQTSPASTPIGDHPSHRPAAVPAPPRRSTGRPTELGTLITGLRGTRGAGDPDDG